MFKIRTSKFRHVFCDQPKQEVREERWHVVQVALDSVVVGHRQEVIEEPEECHENQGFLEDAFFPLEDQTMVEDFLTCRWVRDLFFGFFYPPSRAATGRYD